MNNILLIIDVQQGFQRNQETQLNAKKIEALVKLNLFDKIISTKFINNSDLPYYKWLHWPRLFNAPDTNLLDILNDKSDYIIEKTYNEGIVAEDKLAVLLNILSTRIVKNMLDGNFSSKYLIYIPYDLYDKSTKIGNIFEMFEDEFAKNTIIVLLNYEEIKGNKQVIKNLIKKGYKFAINIGNNKIKESDLELMYIVEYIFMESENKKNKIPKDLRNKIIYNKIMDKVN